MIVASFLTISWLLCWAAIPCGTPCPTWSKSTPLRLARSGYASGTVAGQLIIAGGTYWEGTRGDWKRKIFTSRTDAFDPVSEKWTVLPDAPFPLAYAGSVVIGEKLYVIGGVKDDGKTNRQLLVLQKDGPGGFRWRILGSIPESRVFPAAAAKDRKIILAGGMTAFEPYDARGTCCTTRTATRTVFLIDPSSPSKWDQLSPCPSPSCWFPTSASNIDSIWLFGGASQQVKEEAFAYSNGVLRYDLHADRWEPAGELPKEAIGAPLSAAVLPDRVFLASIAGKAWFYGLASQTFTEAAPLPEEVYVDKLFLVGRNLVGSGGEGRSEGPGRRSESTFIGRLNCLLAKW